MKNPDPFAGCCELCDNWEQCKHLKHCIAFGHPPEDYENAGPEVKAAKAEKAA